MPYVPPKYPGEIPTVEDIPDRNDDVDWLYAARYNELKKELRAALTELGTLPKGGYADVKTRLEALALKANVLELDNVTPFTPDADYEPATKKYVDEIPVVGFTNRGDPAANDWTQATLTADGAWHDLDLSAIVPAGAKAVLFKMLIRDNVIDSQFWLRTKGNVNDFVSVALYTQVANLNFGAVQLAICDTNRVIQYWLSNVVWSAIILTVMGWWK